jgi:anti-sigma factor RsiW
MKCAEFIALASEYVDGYLTDPEAAAFGSHREVCASCARYLRVMERSIKLAGELDEIEPSADFNWRLNRRLREIDEAMAERTRSARTGAALAVAIAGVVVFLAWSPILTPRRAADALASGYAGSARNEAARDDAPGGWEWWYGGVQPAAMKPPNASNAFPGPYSPLRVDPPIRGGGESRTVLMSLIEAE